MNLQVSSGVTCCRECSKRVVGCHSTCEEYLKQKAKRDELNQKRKKFKDAEGDIMRARAFRHRRK